MSDTENQRRHERYTYVTMATLVHGKKLNKLMTADVSFTGLFLSTEEPPPLRELVRVQLKLPSDGNLIELLCMAVHRVPPGGRRAAGIGVLLYGLDPRVRARWDNFIQEVRAGKHGTGPTQDILWPTPRAPAAEPTYNPVLNIRLSNLDALLTFRNRDMARKRTFVLTDVFLEPGTQATIIYTHPEADRTFQIAATVMQQVRRPGIVGLALQLEHVDEQVAVEFDSFLDDGNQVTIDVTVDMELEPFESPE